MYFTVLYYIALYCVYYIHYITLSRAGNGEMFCKAFLIESYLNFVRETLGKLTGKALWIGKHDTFVCIPLGKNMVAKVSYILYICVIIII